MQVQVSLLEELPMCACHFGGSCRQEEGLNHKAEGVEVAPQETHDESKQVTQLF